MSRLRRGTSFISTSRRSARDTDADAVDLSLHFSISHVEHDLTTRNSKTGGRKWSRRGGRGGERETEPTSVDDARVSSVPSPSPPLMPPSPFSLRKTGRSGYRARGENPSIFLPLSFFRCRALRRAIISDNETGAGRELSRPFEKSLEPPKLRQSPPSRAVVGSGGP